MEKKISDRTALIIYCTREEAEMIRHAAKHERRTITGYVMNAVMSRIGLRNRLHEQLLRDQESGSPSRA